MRHYFQSQNIAFRVKEIQKEYKDVFLMDPLTLISDFGGGKKII
jgi:hypothetical protein